MGWVAGPSPVDEDVGVPSLSMVELLAAEESWEDDSCSCPFPFWAFRELMVGFGGICGWSRRYWRMDSIPSARCGTAIRRYLRQVVEKTSFNKVSRGCVLSN